MLDVERGIWIPAGGEVDGLDESGGRAARSQAAHQPASQAALQAADVPPSSMLQPRRAAHDAGRRRRSMRLSATTDDAALRPASCMDRVLLEALRRVGGPRLEAAPTPSRI
ncbi:MAG: hypothetical protein RQ839_09770 [Thermoproteus sp.]|nr:hypothetical protein [Thermoproteus sp.]MDT7882950.1 hypothetical protein [Thermoproteus sp.]